MAMLSEDESQMWILGVSDQYYCSYIFRVNKQAPLDGVAQGIYLPKPPQCAIVLMYSLICRLCDSFASWLSLKGRPRHLNKQPFNICLLP